jgi:hypothetical protein
MSVPLHHSLARPQVANGENDFQTWSVASQNLLRRTAGEKEKRKKIRMTSTSAEIRNFSFLNPKRT